MFKTKSDCLHLKDVSELDLSGDFNKYLHQSMARFLEDVAVVKTKKHRYG